MIRKAIALIVLTLAMLLAPVGICVAQGHTNAATSASHMHHHAATSASPHVHGTSHGTGKSHFCPDCQPASYTGAGKAGPDLTPSLAIAPVLQPSVPPLLVEVDEPLPHLWYGRAPPRPPTTPIATKVRLQI